ncbi:hypothetical protein JCM9140_291 [Halalkalibacter wakoensis JCM 9140]|uniref:DoxX family protein n=1 Tax=Halalkalibacter wakoensis JCM 9140 TaxID=1236970 RepID=W4PZ13_9BACI|nr:DoxX family protein [Halalkalibacter wakoensis]GAE24374.1 hypothetical protein JCM9140_291 [Halalkalibacter wakoensis JCM 9140]
MFLKYEIGSLILRIVLGITFFFHGLAKFQNGLESTSLYFESLGLPGMTAYLVAIIELMGGVALLVGLGTRFVSLLLAMIMVGAILFVKLGAGFLGGFEFDFVLLGIAIYLLINGSKLLSVDSVILKTY